MEMSFCVILSYFSQKLFKKKVIANYNQRNYCVLTAVWWTNNLFPKLILDYIVINQINDLVQLLVIICM